MLMVILVGFLFGFIGSMPVAGPIALLVLRLGLNHDPWHARLVAMGGALAEGLYALAAFWGLSTVLDAYPVILPASRIAGAVICLGLGIALLRYRAKDAPPEANGGRSRGKKRSFLGGFLITALNPTFIVTWTAALAALHATGLIVMAPSRAIPFALAVVLGIVVWFFTLLRLVRRFKGRWSPRTLERFIRGMGVALLLAAAWVGIHEMIRHRGSASSGGTHAGIHRPAALAP